MARAREVAFIDAPVVGSRPQAEAGQLVFLVGGEPAIVERVREVLALMGGAIHHVGPLGAGSTMKLAVNALFGIQVAALAEIVGLLERSGLARGAILEMLGAMPITSPALKGVGGLLAARRYEPLFPIDLVEKDLRYAVATAAGRDTAVPLVTAARDVYARARERGFGGDNIAGVAQLYDA